LFRYACVFARPIVREAKDHRKMKMFMSALYTLSDPTVKNFPHFKQFFDHADSFHRLSMIVGFFFKYFLDFDLVTFKDVIDYFESDSVWFSSCFLAGKNTIIYQVENGFKRQVLHKWTKNRRVSFSSRSFSIDWYYMLTRIKRLCVSSDQYSYDISEINSLFASNYSIGVVGRMVLYLVQIGICFKGADGLISVIDFGKLSFLLKNFKYLVECQYDFFPPDVNKYVDNPLVFFGLECRRALDLVCFELLKIRNYLDYLFCYDKRFEFVSGIVYSNLRVCDLIYGLASDALLKESDFPARELNILKEFDRLVGGNLLNAVWVGLLSAKASQPLIWNKRFSGKIFFFGHEEVEGCKSLIIPNTNRLPCGKFEIDS